MLQQVHRRVGPKRVFLYMGRLATEKNVEALLQAWRMVAPQDSRLVIVGDGPLRSGLMNQYDEASIPGGAMNPTRPRESR